MRDYDSLTHEHVADNYIWMETADREVIRQIGKCELCGEDITRMVHVVGTPVPTEWVNMP
jgi:hypothetical protein